MKNVLYKSSIAVILVLVSGCSKELKSKLGLVSPGPNEYAISTNKPLEMPPHFDSLPEELEESCSKR